LIQESVQSIRGHHGRLEWVSVEITGYDGLYVASQFLITPDSIGKTSKEDPACAVVIISPVRTVQQDDQPALTRWGCPAPKSDAPAQTVFQGGGLVATASEDSESPVQPLGRTTLQQAVGQEHSG
jgi:hypothetical protein